MDEARRRRAKDCPDVFHTLKGGTGLRRGRSSTRDLAASSPCSSRHMYSRESSPKQGGSSAPCLADRAEPDTRSRHIHAPHWGTQEVAEVIFQQVTYGGWPVWWRRSASSGMLEEPGVE